MKKINLLVMGSLFMTLGCFAKNFYLQSLSGDLQTEIKVGKNITFTLKNSKQVILKESSIALQLKCDMWGEDDVVLSVKKESHHNVIASPFYKKAEVKDDYNLLLLRFKDFNLEFRMYDDGLAYRFQGKKKGEIIVEKEVAEYVLSKDFNAWVPYATSRTKKDDCTQEEQLWTDHQSRYAYMRISDIATNKLMISPLVINLDGGQKLCVAESDINDYPGMYLMTVNSQQSTVSGFFARYPTETAIGGHGNIEQLVKGRTDYIARTNGKRNFPWRTFIVTENDGQLLETDMIYRLAEPCKIDNLSWIKPGKTAWDWWNNSALFGVDFKAGFNTETYKYFIDFSAKYGLEYILIDEGWFDTKSTNIFDLAPDLDLREVISYANLKNVGVFLWAGFLSLERDLEKATKHYAQMGIKGFKVDFFNRDDQLMMNYMWKFAEVCAKNELMLVFHGCSKPSGMQRTYPNVVNYEAVFGLEQMRWSKPTVDQVTHDVILPFTRMVAGPMDYTPGAMRNSLKGMYYANKKNPMSQGTRAHQVAAFVVFDSPFNVLADSPSRYIKEDETTSFIARIPTVWDETVVLDGRIGEYIVVAHRKKDKWYIGAMNNWSSRILDLDVSKLLSGTSKLEIFADGKNSEKVPEDYLHTTIDTPADGKIKIHLAPGGGWVAIQK